MSARIRLFETTPASPPRSRRSIQDLVAPLEQIARRSPNLVAQRDARFEVNGETHELPKYIFIGPKGGGIPIRVGIFAAIHGDEPEGAHVLVHLVKSLDASPELAAGYCLSLYPVCNPTGFEDNTRRSRSGRDLNREFWRNSAEPEVRLLETELANNAFDGIISLHTHDVGDGLYGLTRGVTLTKHLIEPALKAAEAFLPRDERTVIEGSPARHGVIRDAAEGTLSAPPKSKPRPFEITLETPKSPPSYLKEYAIVVALQTILTEYRHLIAYAPNL
jgi:predicted deacylase